MVGLCFSSDSSRLAREGSTGWSHCFSGMDRRICRLLWKEPSRWDSHATVTQVVFKCSLRRMKTQQTQDKTQLMSSATAVSVF
ncbi:unnamed protein product [Pleuronectes platessa]|uniref:Uncharacterized protein n=1 Tax=Pleuronectes platessa TaxID=8262 RepID=A0A9N7VD66_PLEPL|nr:unnamed protein product [Pleuronectes platessa]